MASPAIEQAAASTRTEGEVRAKRAAKGRGANWAPRGAVAFAPVPFKLLRVTNRGASEYVAGAEYGGYQGAPFDPWHKGDLVVLQQVLTAWHKGEGQTRHETWSVARRDSTPSTVRAAYLVGESHRVYSYNNVKVYRIPYRYLNAAAQLFGRGFESQSALESAMGNPTNAETQNLQAAQ
jgi:hypothetical protein